MTTRITLAILLTTWVILIIGETAAFFSARDSLLRLLDNTLITRAQNLLDARISSDSKGEEHIPPGDRYQIRDDAGHVASHGEGHHTPAPELTKNEFERDASGVRWRTVELRTFATRDGKRVPFLITYSRPAA